MGHLIFHAGPKGKANRTNAKGMIRHTLRKTKGTKNHKNDDIKSDLTKYNIDYKVSGNYADEIIEYRLENEYKGKRKLRKDHVVLREVVTQPSPEMFEGMTIEQKQKKMADFMKDALPWFVKEFGKENIVGASAHLDETSPHAHVMVMPMKDGKVSQTEFFKSPADLRRQHTEYREHMIARGWDFEKGNKYENIDNHEMPVFKANAKKIQADRAAQTKALRDARIDLSESPEVRKQALEIALDAVLGGVLKSERERLEEDEERLRTEREQFEAMKAELDAKDREIREKERETARTEKLFGDFAVGILKFSNAKYDHKLIAQIESGGLRSVKMREVVSSIPFSIGDAFKKQEGEAMVEGLDQQVNAYKFPPKQVHKQVHVQQVIEDDGPEL